MKAQEAIERVYWSHRIWPKDNPGQKPSFEQVVSRASLEAVVTRTLQLSNALESVWLRPVTSEQMQAELERMASSTRSPETLRELFDALGNEPRLIAETLARQALVDRLARNWFGWDARFHRSIRAEAEAGLSGRRILADATRLSRAEYRELRWVRRAGPDRLEELPDSAANRGVAVVPLTEEEWSELVESLRARFDMTDAPTEPSLEPASGSTTEEDSGGLPLGVPSPLREEIDRFESWRIVANGDSELVVAITAWPKIAFETWWGEQAARRPASMTEPAGTYSLPRIEPVECSVEAWQPTATVPVPAPRSDHTVVWTGTELIVWGGRSERVENTGGRYNPSTDTWTPTSVGPGVPSPRDLHSAVWTGAEMIVWGGQTDTVRTNTGGRYNPVTDSWTATSTENGLAGRLGHSAVWTGSRMVVWGGYPLTRSGGSYDPSTDSWRPMLAQPGIPVERYRHTAVWTGSEMIVWGGMTSNRSENTGGRYDPVSDTWAPTSTAAGVPSRRSWHTAVWTGSEMIVWGGGDTNTGGRYHPGTDSWTPTSTGDGVPAIRRQHTAVWTGTEMIVWGGYSGYRRTNTGGRYDPSNDSWVPLPMEGSAPAARGYHAAAWTGTEMIVWGGLGDNWPTNSGGRYDPSSDSWVPTSTGAPVPSARAGHTAVWTGTEMILWGGSDATDTGGKYTPATDSWAPTDVGPNLPAGREAHTAVWTGTEMIVWGGFPWGIDGGRYNPSTDSWAAMSLEPDAYEPRIGHTAVWTGREMIVWGGGWPLGARYDPSTDSWATISHGGGVAGSEGHTAVWTGNEMIVWGGWRYSNPGGRYDPSTDSWRKTADGEAAPAGRERHTAVWTGAEMIVWGGYPWTNTGGRYDPASDSWIPTSVVGGVPSSRSRHTAVWSGREMIVWGGVSPPAATNSGGRYDPATDTWSALPTETGVPSAREMHSAIWTGSEMIVWGGLSAFQENTGSRYRPGNEGAPCDDGDACTDGETCRLGECVGGIPLICKDDGSACTTESCDRILGCESNEIPGCCDSPNPLGQGFYRRLCRARAHPGDALSPADASCVALSATFPWVASVSDICSVMAHDVPNDEPCRKAEQQLMTLLLNRCRGRVCDSAATRSACGAGHDTVGESTRQADRTLSDDSRVADACRHALCETEEINSGAGLVPEMPGAGDGDAGESP